MNYLYLVGNGFDLAHKLPTSYQEFILSFYKESIFSIKPNKIYSVGPMVINKLHDNLYDPEVFTLKELIELCNRNNVTFDYPNKFFQKIVDDYSDERWVDIEFAYYLEILEILAPEHRISNEEYDLKGNVVKLNNELNEIKSLLLKYLKSIKTDDVQKSEAINSHIRNPNKELNEQNLFLNFNYTSIIEKYIDRSRGDENINIHGNLEDNLDDIIFGYGDEMDLMYPSIENLNINEFLDNFKSFGYLKKGNYQRLNSFLNSDFEVIIMGHSCGISDRVLLNSIFTKKECIKIHICYYEKSETRNDFFEKTQEISRHFGTANKEEMRVKIVPFDESNPLIPYTDN